MEFSTLRLTLAFCLTALATSAIGHDGEPDFFGKLDGTAHVFSVPFFIEGGTTGRVWAKFLLKKPAILENYMGSCNGAASTGLIAYDNGPKGLNGTTASAGETSTDLVAGSDLIQNELVFPFQAVPLSNGEASYVVPTTHLGLPVKSEVDMYIFSAAKNFMQCQMVMVFRSID